MNSVNFVAVLVSAVLSMVIGFIWYGPVAGKAWMREMAIDPKKIKFNAEVQKSYVLSFIGALVTAYVLSMLIRVSYSDTLIEGLMTGFWVWGGFIMPVQLTDVLFGGRSWNLFFINTSYQLFSILAMGAILALFR